jgi:hypothetical protein
VIRRSIPPVWTPPVEEIKARFKDAPAGILAAQAQDEDGEEPPSDAESDLSSGFGSMDGEQPISSSSPSSRLPWDTDF